jgi:hypothetical protein
MTCAAQYVFDDVWRKVCKGVRHDLDNARTWKPLVCVLEKGHDGPHKNGKGIPWEP